MKAVCVELDQLINELTVAAPDVLINASVWLLLIEQ